MGNWQAEVIAIGDELVSGQRLDTNSRWISQQLEELGIRTAYHTTVGDDLQQNLNVFRQALSRANLVICTGGLGPTADDLTRAVIAQATDRPLIRDQAVVEHIRQMYQSRNLEMPDNNLSQADFPQGSTIIANPEGTAPGIDLEIPQQLALPNTINTTHQRIFALPGVPAELKQMWTTHLSSALRSMLGKTAIIQHHSLHAFGEGESTIEMMLPDLIRRGKDPSTGITASGATITLRVSTFGADADECQAKIQPVLETIRRGLGDLVYGENGQSLAGVVVDLLTENQQTIAVIDAGLRGDAASSITAANDGEHVLAGATLVPRAKFSPDNEGLKEANRIRSETNADYGISISPIDRSETAIDEGRSNFTVAIAGPQGTNIQTYAFRGHSDWRQQRAVKQVLNQLRLFIGRSSL